MIIMYDTLHRDMVLTMEKKVEAVSFWIREINYEFNPPPRLGLILDLITILHRSTLLVGQYAS